MLALLCVLAVAPPRRRSSIRRCAGHRTRVSARRRQSSRLQARVVVRHRVARRRGRPGARAARLPGHVLPRADGHRRGQPERVRAATGAVRARGAGRPGRTASCVTRSARRARVSTSSYAREGARRRAGSTTGRFATWATVATARVVRGEDFQFDLTLQATQPPLLQGERGFSRKGPDPRAASHYYSLPQLRVSGTSRGRRHARSRARAGVVRPRMVERLRRRARARLGLARASTCTTAAR